MMAAKLIICGVLCAFFLSQAQALSLPVLDLTNPQKTLESFENFTNSLVGDITKLSGEALGFAQKSKNEVVQLAQSVVNTTRAEIQKEVEKVISRINNSSMMSPLKNTLGVAQCTGKAVAAAAGVGETALKSVIACTTDQVNAILGPVEDLIVQGKKGLSLGVNIYKNMSDCFPGGFSNVNMFNIVGDLLCAFGKLGPLSTEVTGITTSIIKDVQAVKEAVANTRTAIVRCPRERMAEVVMNLGGVVSDYGKCVSALFAPSNTTAAPSS